MRRERTPRGIAGDRTAGRTGAKELGKGGEGTLPEARPVTLSTRKLAAL